MPCRVLAVPSLVERAVSNLVDNALKFSPSESPVEVSCRDGVVLVRDHGPGIDAGEAEAVFERFYRADEARTKPGSGLGLSIVRKVAEQFGGRAWVDQPRGSGAELVISLPTVEE